MVFDMNNCVCPEILLSFALSPRRSLQPAPTIRGLRPASPLG